MVLLYGVVLHCFSSIVDLLFTRFGVGFGFCRVVVFVILWMFYWWVVRWFGWFLVCGVGCF